ncbi:toll/interleukin-1 receptor domain-containing protein [Rhodoferax sp.]|uniref:toll/interleukin-1 receptor domain-containing protein n=1 Tax=Rhodoferax sp. TaxID=50421 RepID=UPI00374DC5E8
MADIFLSYTEHDRDSVRRLAETLQAVGWSVWWDRRIPAGQTWRSVLDAELKNMRCMVVLWSSRSVVSEWVCEEAAEGRQLGRLVPVMIEKVRPPAGFREVQAADLIDWDGSRNFTGLQQLLDDIGRLIGKPAAEPSPRPQPADDEVKPPRPVLAHWLPWMLAGLLILAAIYIGMARKPPMDTPHTQEPAAAAVTTPTAAISTVPAPNASASQAGDQPAIATNLPPPKTPVTAAQHPPAKAPNPKCAALQDRLALGETLSPASENFFHQECQK